MDNNNIKENIEHANSLYSQAKYNEAIQIYQELLKVTLKKIGVKCRLW